MAKVAHRVFVMLILLAVGGGAAAQNPGPGKDPFRGRLFPPDLILQHRDVLQLSPEQLQEIRTAVIEVQTNIAEHQWDMREAYQLVFSALDENPVDEAAVLERVQAAMRAENEIKKLQVAMLIKVRNVLDEAQVRHLRSMASRNPKPPVM
jgi:hypothetical protein